MSMDGFGFSRINPDYKNSSPQYKQHSRIIDFVMLDTTSQHEGGLAYQLIKDIAFTEEELKEIKEGIYPIPRPPFSPLGLVQEVKLHSKQLILTDGNTIQFNHLVVVKGTQPSLLSYEFISAFYTLVDALRVQKWVPEAMQFPKIKKPKVVIQASLTPKDAKNSIWLDHFPTHSKNEGTFLYAESNRKLYQVHL